MSESSSLPVITIHLKELRFFAYHGLHDFEKTDGNEFEMDVKLSFRQKKELITGIDETLNYADVYGLIKEEMAQPRELLETFLGELAAKLRERYPQITVIDMTLYKLTAPIEGLKGQVGVCYYQD